MRTGSLQHHVNNKITRRHVKIISGTDGTVSVILALCLCVISPTLTRGEGEIAKVPTEAFSSSMVGTEQLELSEGRGLILILNFFRWSSSPSDSLEETALALRARVDWSRRLLGSVYTPTYTAYKEL